MKRRNFFKTTSIAALSGLFPFTKMVQNAPALTPKIIKPTRLRTGATVALIAPSSPPSEEKLIKGIENLTQLGFTIIEGKHLRSQNGHLAGTDAQRLSDLHWAFENPEVEAVWCIRGGYGATRLLPELDYALIKRNPKPFIGYSDITALHLAIQQRTGLVTFHGQVAGGAFPEDTWRCLQAVLMQPEIPFDIAAPSLENIPEGIEYQPFTILSGQAKGTLIGGNLALLAAMAGTDFAPIFSHKIVFIEDIGEQPYRIDRLLTQLLQGTDLKAAAGIALGVFNDCQPKPGSPSLSLEATLRDRLGGLGIPVVYGIPFGHVDHQATLPYGIKAYLDADQKVLRLLENAVI